jgi:hypothetical protein
VVARICVESHEATVRSHQEPPLHYHELDRRKSGVTALFVGSDHICFELVVVPGKLPMPFLTCPHDAAIRYLCDQPAMLNSLLCEHPLSRFLIQAQG